MPERIQRKRTAGWRLPPNTVCVSRPSRWGNPFVRSDAFECYRCWLRKPLYTPHYILLMFDGAVLHPQYEHLRYMTAAEYLRNIEELRGKNLACWCPVGASCHADTLLKLANRQEIRDG